MYLLKKIVLSIFFILTLFIFTNASQALTLGKKINQVFSNKYKEYYGAIPYRLVDQLIDSSVTLSAGQDNDTVRRISLSFEAIAGSGDFTVSHSGTREEAIIFLPVKVKVSFTDDDVINGNDINNPNDNDVELENFETSLFELYSVPDNILAKLLNLTIQTQDNDDVDTEKVIQLAFVALKFQQVLANKGKHQFYTQYDASTGYGGGEDTRDFKTYANIGACAGVQSHFSQLETNLKACGHIQEAIFEGNNINSAFQDFKKVSVTASARRKNGTTEVSLTAEHFDFEDANSTNRVLINFIRHYYPNLTRERLLTATQNN